VSDAPPAAPLEDFKMPPNLGLTLKQKKAAGGKLSPAEELLANMADFGAPAAAAGLTDQFRAGPPPASGPSFGPSPMNKPPLGGPMSPSDFSMTQYNQPQPPIQPEQPPMGDIPMLPPLEEPSPFGTGGFSRGSRPPTPMAPAGTAPGPTMTGGYARGSSPPPAGPDFSIPLLPELESMKSQPPGAAGPQGPPGGPAMEAPEASAAQNDELATKRKELNRLEGLRDIAEGLGNIYAPTAGELLMGLPPPEKFQARGFQRRIGELEAETAPENDPQSPISRQAQKFVLENFGIKTTSPYSLIQANLPTVGRAMTAGYSMGARRSMKEEADAQKGKAGVSSAIAAERGSLFKEVRLRKLREQLDNVKKLKELIEVGNPIASRAAFVAAARASGDTGVLTERDIAAWQGELGIPGLGKRLEKFITGDYSDDVKTEVLAFAAKAAETIKSELQNERHAREESFRAVHGPAMEKYGTGQDQVKGLYNEVFGPQGGEGMGDAAGGGEEVHVLAPDGKIRRVPRQIAEEEGWEILPSK
jgi:hypothetical protein